MIVYGCILIRGVFVEFFVFVARKLRYPALLALSLCLGLGIGLSCGSVMLHRALLADSAAFFLFRPAGEFFSVYSMINSDNDLIRLSGYYSMLDYGHGDDAFLMERYSLERSDTVKRTIVWMLGFSHGSGVAKFLTDSYADSSGPIKGQILKSLSRVDPGGYRDFIRKNSIKNGLQGM